MRFRLSSFVVLLGVITTPVLACLWDNDTLRDERRGLPGIAEILSGRFERHSDFFYRDRVKKMEARLAAEPNDLAAYDNLAVAHEKVGDIPAAIDVIQRKDKLKPGEYTTHANLGTFYLHAGDFENGIAHIRKALEINPDAHFGRETYQLQVAEYLKRAKDDPAVLDEGSFVMPILLRLWSRGGGDPAAMDAQQRREAQAVVTELFRTGRGRRDDADVEKAIEGIVGMIRFGTGTSPHLYFALGDLLASRGDKQLAYRAYKRALDYGHPRPKMVTDAMEQVKEMVEHPTEMADAFITRERDEAAQWLAAYQSYEDALVRAGKDTDDESNYTAFYKQHGPATPPVRSSIFERVMRRDAWPALAGLGVVGVGFLWLAWRAVFGKRSGPTPAGP